MRAHGHMQGTNTITAYTMPQLRQQLFWFILQRCKAEQPPTSPQQTGLPQDFCSPVNPTHAAPWETHN